VGGKCEAKTEPESPCLNIGLGITAVTLRTMMSTANGSHDKENWGRQYSSPMWYTNFRRYWVVPLSSSLCFASSWPPRSRIPHLLLDTEHKAKEYLVGNAYGSNSHSHLNAKAGSCLVDGHHHECPLSQRVFPDSETIT
jgi:hypothetical protein